MLQTGDLVLTRSPGFTNSLTIFGTKDGVNHAAIVIRLKDGQVVEKGEEGSLYILDMSRKAKFCYYSNKVKEGVKLIPYEIFIKPYNRIESLTLKDRSKISKEKITKFIEESMTYKFSYNLNNFIGPWLKLPLKERDDNAYSCIQFVLKFYSILGIYLPFKTLSPASIKRSSLFTDFKVLKNDFKLFDLISYIFNITITLLILTLIFYILAKFMV